MNKIKNKNKNNFLAWIYCLPALVIISFIIILPILSTVRISFTNMSIYNWNSYKNVGLQNYKKALTSLDSGFLNALLITMLWTAITMFIQLVLAFLIALGLNFKYLYGKTFFKTILMFPWAIPAYIGILLWRMGLLNTEFGFLNQLIKSVGFNSINYLSKPINVFITCLVVNLWLALPYMITMMDGAINSIDESIYESAMIDGANYWTVRFRITVPLIKPILMSSIIMTTFITFKQFDTIYLMTMQRGSVTGAEIHSLMTYVYERAFITNAYGYSGAVSVIVFIIILFLSVIMQLDFLRGDKR